MPRYARPQAGWVADETYGDDYPLTPILTVPEHEPVNTGLFYPSGEPVMRLPNPIGFGRDHEW